MKINYNYVYCHPFQGDTAIILRKFIQPLVKVMSIFLLIVYTNTAFGVAVNYHYCDNYLYKISILNFLGPIRYNHKYYQIVSNHNIIPSVSVTGLFSMFHNQYPLQNNLFEF